MSEKTKKKVIIDNDTHGWADAHEDDIEKTYDEIIKVGRTKIDDKIVVPAESKDELIGNYCFENNFELLTADKGAYTKIFRDARIKTVKITQYDIWEEGKRPIYLIKILSE